MTDIEQQRQELKLHNERVVQKMQERADQMLKCRACGGRCIMTGNGGDVQCKQCGKTYHTLEQGE